MRLLSRNSTRRYLILIALVGLVSVAHGEASDGAHDAAGAFAPVGAAVGGFDRAVAEDLVPPSTALYCPQKNFCPSSHTPAICGMDALYRANASGSSERIDANIQIVDENFCKAAQRVCDTARRVKSRSEERPIYCYEPPDEKVPGRGKPRLAAPTTERIVPSEVSLVTEQTVDLRRVRSELKRAGLLGIVSIDDNRFGGNGLTLVARTEAGDESLMCDRVKANEFLKDAIKTCTPQPLRNGGIGEIESIQ